MSTPIGKKRTARSNSKTRNPATSTSVSRPPTLSSMEELSSDIEKSLRQPRLSYLVRSANDELHDVELRTDESEMFVDPMNDRTPSDPANIIIEAPAIFTKESFQVVDEEDSDMESEAGSSLPFLLPRSVEEANHVIQENCICNHITVHSVSKNKIFLIRNTPCRTDDQEPEGIDIGEKTQVDTESITEIPDSVLDRHLRGVKRSREENEDLPVNAKRVIRDFAKGKIPNFSLMDGETMQHCSDFM